MDIYTIDFETFYDQDYSLSKVTTESYIRDDRFEAIMVGIKKNDGPVKVVPQKLIKPVLQTIDFSNAAILAHHTAFDGAISSWRYGVRPRFWFDTLSMARPLHSITVGGSLGKLVSYYGLGEKGTEVVNAKGKRAADFTPTEMRAYEEYCANDVELTYQLFKKMRKEIPPSELLVIDQTIRMFTEPRIVLDPELLERHLHEVREAKQNRLQVLADQLGLADTHALLAVLMSNKQFAEILERHGVEPPTKTSPTTGKSTFAFAKTDKAMTELAEHEDETVALLAQTRLGVKSSIEETRTEAFIEISKRGPLPIMLNYYGAHTGRFSGGDKVNLQNLPSRQNNTIRKALMAPEGHVVMACDSSQIEARMVAWLAGQRDLTEAFAEGRDVYCEFGGEIYGRKITKEDKIERFVGKTGILSLGYSAGWARFKEMLRIQNGIDMEDHQAQRVVSIYRQKYHRIASLWRTCGKVLDDMVIDRSGVLCDLLPYSKEGIVLPNGLKIQYPGLMIDPGTDEYRYVRDPRAFREYLKQRVLNGVEFDTSKWARIYGAKVVENLVQALAGIIVRWQMTNASAELKLSPVFQVHDENVWIVPNDRIEEAAAIIERHMSMAPPWAPGLPVACELHYGPSYGECK